MSDYYNEIDPYAAQWLRNLMDARLIRQGDIDTRSIEDVRPDDLAGYTQCHFFAGLGGWAYALQLAQWPADRKVWTGSCPCQPFSAAGKGAGFADERHLWPAWFHLIEQCRPSVLFGEQVASSAVDAWVDLVHADLEAVGYAFRSVPFPAAGVGAPHIRDRNYWLADADRSVSGEGRADLRGRSTGSDAHTEPGFGGGGVPLGMADAIGRGRLERRQDGQSVRMADTPGVGREMALQHGSRSNAPSGIGQTDVIGSVGMSEWSGPVNGFWADADRLRCRDGKWRPVEPGTLPLAHGVPGRVGRLRAYGNAIVPQAAAEFVKAYLACRP